MTRTPQDIVQAEVHYCVSTLVSTLASAYDDCANKDANALCEQALELAAPIDDWEEAAIQAGWRHMKNVAKNSWYRHNNSTRSPAAKTDIADSAIEACELDNLEPYQREVYEHWIVSDWLADQLEAYGEKVDRDFAGMTVWARTTTGQVIYADGVFDAIAADLAREG